MIFTSWLMVLQLVTVLAGFIIGAAFQDAKRFKVLQYITWAGILFVGAGMLWFYVHLSQIEDRTNTNELVRTSQVENIKSRINSSMSRQNDIDTKIDNNVNVPRGPVVYPGEKFNGYARPGECLYSKRERGQARIFTRSCNG